MNIYSVIILDESGSMSSIYQETIQSMNEVLSGIRRDQEEHPDQHHYVTIVTFEGNGIGGIKTRRDRVPKPDGQFRLKLTIVSIVLFTKIHVKNHHFGRKDTTVPPSAI